MKWAIQYNIFLKTEYSNFRVPKSTWQVGAVYSFFCFCRKLLINQDIHIRKSKRGPPAGSSFHKNKRMENLKMKDIKYIIADNVKLYRKKQNLTQFELAEKAELSVDSIKRIEHGSRTMSLENFMRIADALAVPLSYLMYENLNEIPITERILNILNNKSGKQQEYLLHILEEMSFGLDNLS